MLARTIRATLLAIIGCGLAGCDATQRRDTANPVTAQPGAESMTAEAAQAEVPRQSSAELMDYIGNQPFVTAEAGYRAAHFLARGESFDGDFPALSAELAGAAIIDDGWHYAPDYVLRRADVGYMICRACDIRTGINWPLFGLGRYAYRELQYLNIAGPGGEWALVSGGEFQGIVRRADEYRRRAGGPRAELGPQP